MNVTVKVIPETQLSPLQLTHLRVAREVAKGVPVLPASLNNHVKIIGAYAMYEGKVYITPERLNRLSTTTNTVCHELGHAVSKADDGTSAHDKAIKQVTARLVNRTNRGELDGLLSKAIW